MKIKTKELKKRANEIERVVIESVDLSLYLAHAVVAGEERVICDDRGDLWKTKNLLDMKRAVKELVACELFLRQRSAYDEMVGHNHGAVANTFEISLGNEPLPEWLH